MPRCKITVLKRMLNPELAQEYRQDEVQLCEFFEEGQEFIIDGWSGPPDGFCDWAWYDIQRIFVALMSGGTFGPAMKNERAQIMCCTDGFRPVVFKLERTD